MRAKMRRREKKDGTEGNGSGGRRLYRQKGDDTADTKSGERKRELRERGQSFPDAPTPES